MLNSCAKTLALPSVFLCPIVFTDTKENTIMIINLCKIAAAKPYGTICKLAGKAWIPVKGFESHLDEELALQTGGALEH